MKIACRAQLEEPPMKWLVLRPLENQNALTWERISP